VFVGWFVHWFVGTFIAFVVISHKVQVRFSWNSAQMFSICTKCRY